MAILRATAPTSPGGMKTTNASALKATRAADVVENKAIKQIKTGVISAPPVIVTTVTPVSETKKTTTVVETFNEERTTEKQQDTPKPKPPTAGELGVVKTPGRDVTRISDLVQQTPADTIKRIAFEQLSAIELSQIVTSNTVDGINQKYSVVSNLSDIRTRFDASRQLSVMNKATPMTGVYNIDIDSKIPGESYLLANNLYAEMSYKDVDGTTVSTVEKGNIYIDTNGDLVIEFDNMRDDEIVQIQINADGTIYEVNNDY